ncbi:DENND6A-like isoform X1 [Paramuricea clavata]|uniref:DENND6A-like isoform X1 n=1 Tax=Paramuricea clavata TaxID=317549 RepID=A0A7D9I930_PARCT|nr:DENND6A-like isoform X1 [Paramuricea clavata]
MAPSPSLCSDVVQSLITLIQPLHFNSDFRPFFTIHDSEFKEYTTKTHAPPPIIIGVTNPFFAKTLQHWPHILRIGPMNNLVIGSRPSPLGNEKKSFEAKPGIYTRYKPFLQKDKPFIKTIKKGGQKKRPTEVQNAILRKHMRELTQSFMIPLERYAASLMPLQRSISPWKLPPKLKCFDAEEFLKTVEHSGPQLTSVLKGNWKGLYRSFFKSANFEGWFRNRQYEIQQKLQLLHLEALSVADMTLWTSAKNEVEIVDFILKTREKMSSAKLFETQITDDVWKKLTLQMENVLETLPEDLQLILRQN